MLFPCGPGGQPGVGKILPGTAAAGGKELPSDAAAQGLAMGIR